MVTELIVKGLSASKLQVIAETYAGKISMLKIRDVKTSRLLAQYEHHEWLYNRIPMDQLQEIMSHVSHIFF